MHYDTGGRVWISPDVQQASKVDVAVMRHLHLCLPLQNIFSGGFSKDDYHIAGMDLYISADFLFTMKRNFVFQTP